MSDLTEWLRCRIEQARNYLDYPYCGRDTRAEYESEIQHLSDAAADSALLDRVLAECKVTSDDGSDCLSIAQSGERRQAYIHVIGPPDVLRQFAERLKQD